MVRWAVRVDGGPSRWAASVVARGEAGWKRREVNEARRAPLGKCKTMSRAREPPQVKLG